VSEPKARSPACDICGVEWFYHGGMPHDFEHDEVRASTQREPLYLDTEIVICSAVLAADGRVFRCHRHHDGLRVLEAAGVAYGAHEQEQGFVTSRNRYVDRYEALRIQRAAGIESVAPGGYRGKQLFSEDLY